MIRVLIKSRFDTFEAQRKTRTFALELGFTQRACSELAIVSSELSSNILKYASQGRIELASVDEEAGHGIAIRAHDKGPPFRSVEIAMQDGCDDTGPIDPDRLARRNGHGSGLGAVIRMTHEFRVEQGAGGKCVIATRYLGKPLASLASRPFTRM